MALPSDYPRYSPMWWVAMLEPKLDAQARKVATYEQYYEGLQVNWAMQTAKYREHFRTMIQAVSDNWVPIVVDSVAERMDVQGFRMGNEIAADKDAQYIWQYNNMDLISDQLFTTTLTCGIASMIVWASGNERYPVKMTAEHPNEVYVALGSGNGDRIAAIKRWVDEWGEIKRLNLYLPEAIYKFYKDKRYTEWTPYNLNGNQYITNNPLGVVPVIPFRNRSNLKVGSWASEIWDVLSTQDQINKLVMDLLVASEFGAFRQRWITGVDVPVDENGKPIETFKAALDRVWMLEDPNVKLGEFGAFDLGNIVKAIESRIQSLASRSRTPPHYMLGQSGAFPSGESLKATETGLVAKVRKRQKQFGEPLEIVNRIGFAVIDSPKSHIMDSETIWGDPESRTEVEHVDALVK